MVSRLTDRERYAADTEEAEAIKAFRDFATIHGGWFGHLDGDLSGQRFAGWLDITIAFPGVLCCFEIKIGEDRLSAAQQLVLSHLTGSGVISGVVRYGRKRPGEIDQDEAFDLMRKALAR